ncbi:hypothetical protein MHBO_002143 [Bonamia ostreae]|uniref:ornithine decarboxylase n=1 Tax=Bonamia ostreae TaxID=126728 RepID=A0ABV2ALE5_9EUKA
MNTFNTNNIEQKIRIKIDYSKTLEKTLLEMSTKNAEKQNPFFLVDLACLSRKLKHWEKTFPFVKPFYAVKCNPDEKIVSVLEKMGVNFDCASCSEMQFLLRKKNFDSRRIIFANPHKSQKEIKFALSNKVFLMTFDCKEELHKIVDAAKSFKNFENILNKIRIVLRIKVDNPKALNKLNEKYGAPLETIDQIIEETKRLKLVLEGISFHVGSGCYDANAYVNVLENAKYAFQKAKQLCSPLKILDIGGGFPGGSHGGFMVNGEHDKIFLEEIGNVFDEKMNTSLSFLKDVTVISEPVFL